jgi:hypothetical protein
MRYVRVFTDEEGDSHFEETEFELSPVEFAPPAPPIDLSASHSATRVLFGHSPLGWRGEPHPAPMRQFFLLLRGRIEVQASDGERRTFGPGSIILLEDTTGKGHVTEVVSDGGAFGAFIQLK